MDIFGDDLTIAHSNLAILRQIQEFDSGLFEAPSAFLVFLADNLVDQCLIILTRLWRDETHGVITINKFVEWLQGKAIRPQCLPSIASQITEAMPDPHVEDVIKRCRKIRHARLAHLSADLGLKTTPVQVHLTEIESAVNALGTLFNVISFGTMHCFVLVQFHSSAGQWHEGDFGYVLDRIALGSKWFSDVDKYPSLWNHLRKTLDSEQLKKINQVRERHNMKQLK